LVLSRSAGRLTETGIHARVELYPLGDSRRSVRLDLIRSIRTKIAEHPGQAMRWRRKHWTHRQPLAKLCPVSQIRQDLRFWIRRCESGRDCVETAHAHDQVHHSSSLDMGLMGNDSGGRADDPPAYRTLRTSRIVIEVLVFLAVAFAVTWAAGSLILASDQADLIGGGLRRPQLVLPVGVAITLLLVADLGPTLGALVALASSGGSRGVRMWLSQLKQWRISWYWYALALVGPTAMGIVAIAAFVAAGGRMDASWIVLQPGRIALTAVGGWAEELGWRGFAQPKLQSRLGAAPAAVVVGVMWSVWHQWQLVAPGGAAFNWADAMWSVLYLVSISVLVAWIYNSTRASLPAAIAAHVGINAVRFNPYPVGPISIVFAFSALIVTLVTGPLSLVGRGTAPPDPFATARR